MKEYGFYGRLRANMPSQIIIDIDQNCNYACVHCPHGQFRKSNVYTGARLPVDINKKIVDEVAKYGNGDVQQLRYTANGEPLLHPEAIEILSYAVLQSKTIVSLTTNGSLLTSEKSQKLLEVGIGLIDISIDAYCDSTYAAIRVNGKLSLVRDNVNELLRLRDEMGAKTKIVTSFVKQPLNINEMSDFENYWRNQGVYQVVFRELHTAGGAMKDGFEVQETNYQPCVYPWERLCVGPNGEYEFCPASWQGKTDIGYNAKDYSIYDVWHSKAYENLRNEHLSGLFSNYCVCGDCPDRNGIIWPGKDDRRAYGDMIAEIQRND